MTNIWRTILVCVVAVSAACSGGAEASQPVAALADIADPTAVPSATATAEPTAEPTPTAAPTATPEPTATPAPTATPQPDPRQQVADALLMFQTERNDLITSGDTTALHAFLAAHAWPPGEWTPQQTACANPNPRSLLFDPATLVETPAWAIPATSGSSPLAEPGEGTWAVVATVPALGSAQVHVFFDGADIYTFPAGSATC